MITPEKRHADFPSLEGRVYLNSAAESIPPRAVGEALHRYWEDKLQGMKGRDAHFATLESCREASARALGWKTSEVAFCSCSAEAYNLLASALALKENDEVVINDLDFPSGATPWLAAGAGRVRLWKSRDGALRLEDLEPLLGKNTRLVQTSLVSFYNGYRLPWKPFESLVRARAPQALLAADVTQALGRVVLDCQGADLIVSSTHKWILGMHGGCVVGVREGRADELTTRSGGWYHLENAFSDDRFQVARIRKGAPSFSVGMPNFAAIYALDAATRYVEAVGVGNIARVADPLVLRLREGLDRLGIAPMAPVEQGMLSGIVSFRHPRSEQVFAALQAANIHVMQSAGRLRASVHGYNSADDVDRLLEVLESV